MDIKVKLIICSAVLCGIVGVTGLGLVLCNSENNPLLYGIGVYMVVIAFVCVIITRLVALFLKWCI